MYVQKHSSYSTALLVVIREKINSLPHQGLILDLISISKDDLDDILEGNTDMNIHQLLSLIYKAGFFDVLNITNNLCIKLSQFGFYFQNGNLSQKDDELLSLYREFYKHNEFITHLKSHSLYGCIEQPTSAFFHYCTNENFRNAFNEESLYDFQMWNVFR
ncbi:TPA: hypothetical protein PWU90_001086 [Mannheimia haemolytica]|uniref:hypothetical protein n=1 Tax=Mannheimia haemolytica TaxID=75985 RepID=UPI001E2EDD56|nr:hypothetical protein [Mannheimia haemolytica]UFK43712.1 hypothetical protein LO774_05850 [Mannheimia haemolytica]HDL1112834.1 hypothetical protein [Mannheimia haemolytica]HDL1115275.1 hypothetical protein [Mannheimia haemolytica]HDL1123435.1 hypothetical protein [Mannheimia haemolytica]HDL1126037.1 hypothetical protein [Mannheimia haemolytica]